MNFLKLIKSRTFTRKSAMALFIAPLIGIFALPTAPAHAATVRVDTIADDPLSAISEACSLRDAIYAIIAPLMRSSGCEANATGTYGVNDTILFDSSISGQTILLAATLPNITSTSSLTIDGGALGNITISGGSTVATGVRILTHTGTGNLTLLNLRFENGSSPPNGGGAVLKANSSANSLTVRNCFFFNNRSTGQGGAIFIQQGSLTVTNSTFSQNFGGGQGGGAISNSSTSSWSVDSSTFIDNLATGTDGGAIWNEFGTGTVTNSTFYNNHANNAGAGIFARSGSVTVSNSTFSTNDAPIAASVAGMGGSLTLRNTILSNPTNTTNAATPQNCSSFYAVQDGGGNLSDDTSCNLFASGRSQNGVSAGLASGAPTTANGGTTGTIALQPNSAAIDHGVNANVPGGVTTDQRGPGFPRFLGAGVDIGAYEYQPTSNTFVYQATLDGLQVVPPTASPGSGTSTVTYDAAAHTLRIQVTYSNLLGPPIQAHVHGPAPAGATAAVLFSFFLPSTPSGSYDQSFVFSNSTFELDVASYLAQGLAYIDIHTPAFNSGGEIRGQYGNAPAPVCGNGQVEPGEQCDDNNGCCNACQYEASGIVCRPSAGVCDVAETCNGVNATCAADQFESNLTECRAAAGPCDLAEACTGSSAACPADTLQPIGTVCRASTNDCDVAEACTGASPTCPADVGANCDDNNLCTNDYCAVVGGCSNTPVNQDDGDACTIDSCTASGGVTHTPRGPYTITASAGANGSIAPSGSTPAPCGMSKTFNISATTGYKISTVLVDGGSVSFPPGATTFAYSFNNVTANHTISATFSPIVAAGPTITSQNHSEFRVGVANSFQVTSNPAATSYTITGTLPSGVTFVTTGANRGKLSGNPNLLQLGVYSLKITPYNGTVAGTPQTFTLKVQDFGLIGIPLVSEIKQGKTGTFAIGLAGVVDFSSVVNLSCSGPSTYVQSCTVTPASMTLSGVKSASATLVLKSNAPKNSSFTVTFTAVAPATTGPTISGQSTRSSPALVKVPK